MTRNLDEIRNKIDHIDDELLALFTERMTLAGEVATYKKENVLPILNPKRENEILLKVSENAPEDIEGYGRMLFNTLFDVSRAYQNQIISPPSKLQHRIESALESTPKVFPSKAVVACQGIDGSYSQMACQKLFSFPQIMYFNTFESVFSAVEKGLCQYGILPLENSSYGSVNQVYDLMKNYDFHIARSIKLRISHTLLGKPGTKFEDITEIVSHEQAIGQCGEFLKNLKVKITVVENTAVAAQMVANSESNTVAAISSKNCASLYGLEVLNDSIQLSDNNYTRFICISKKLEIYPGSLKISLMLSLPHKPMSLYHTIAKFSALGLNLTKLESRPVPGSDFEFMFYFDLEASVYSPEVIRLLSQLENEPDLFIFLGSYSEV